MASPAAGGGGGPSRGGGQRPASIAAGAAGLPAGPQLPAQAGAQLPASRAASKFLFAQRKTSPADSSRGRQIVRRLDP